MPRTAAKKRPPKPPPVYKDLEEGYYGERVAKLQLNLHVEIRRAKKAKNFDQFYIIYLKRKTSDGEFYKVGSKEKYIDTTWPVIDATEREVNFYLRELSLLPKFKKINMETVEDELEF
jgi:hypothetical protein